MKVLMLAPWMSLGHGVSELIGATVPLLAARGVESTVGCLGHDDHFKRLRLEVVGEDPRSVLRLVEEVEATAVIAFGSPYFEVLPHLTGVGRTIALEAGDPTPELFESDASERQRIVEFKREHVYPHVDAVLAISEFIRHDIGWAAAEVFRLGVDNIPDLGPKPLSPPSSSRPIKVGALSRMGRGEARYKGVDQLLELDAKLAELGVERDMHIMGKGTAKDARPFAERGFTVHLNATEENRNSFLADMDVFVSTSLWEGTNLPLVEAQALGTPGLALDTGAHPEFTPLIFSSVEEIALQIRAYSDDMDGTLLHRHGLMAYRFVRATMSWPQAAERIDSLLRGASTPIPPPVAWRPRGSLVRRAGRSLREEGIKTAAAKAGWHVRHRLR